MNLIKQLYKGESLSFSLVFPNDYDMVRIESHSIWIGEQKFVGVPNGQAIELFLKSSETANIAGVQKLFLWLDDSTFGVKKYDLGSLDFVQTKATDSNDSINLGFDVLVTLTITETAITVDNVLYNYFKGADGNGIESTELISTVGLVKTYRITYTDGTTFDYDVTGGEQGAAFTYADFTPENITELQQPAIDAAAIANQAAVDTLLAKTATENLNISVTNAEGLRVTAEEGRATAEGLRVISESDRVIAEAERVSVGLSLQLKIQSDITILTTGDGKYIYTIPAKLNGYDIESIHASLTTASSLGLPAFKVYNLRSAAEILSTNVTIDATEFSSYTALTQPVVNAANKCVLTGDRLRIDCVAAGTGAKGFGVIIKFVKP